MDDVLDRLLTILRGQEITITRRDGSFTFEECLADLVRRRVLSLDEARARAQHREELDGLLARDSGVQPAAGPDPN